MMYLLFNIWSGSRRNDSWDISSRLSKSKSILFVVEEIVPVEVINDLLVDDSLKFSTDDIKDDDWLLLRRR